MRHWKSERGGCIRQLAEAEDGPWRAEAKLPYWCGMRAKTRIRLATRSVAILGGWWRWRSSMRGGLRCAKSHLGGLGP